MNEELLVFCIKVTLILGLAFLALKYDSLLCGTGAVLVFLDSP